MIDGKDPQQDQPEKGSPQIVDMDGPTTRLVALVGSAWQRGEWIHGAQKALRIADQERHAIGLRERDVSGRVAVDYLERVIRALEREAAHAARFGWGRYRSLWYLRRLPMEIFAGDDGLATTASYDLRLAEVLMTRGSDPGVVPVRFDKYGCFPIDESVARRLARSIGFVKTVSEYQRHYRRCAKGATFRFERRDQLPSFEMSDELATAIRFYDERRADDLGRDVTQGLGTPVLDLERRPPKEREVEDRIVLVGDILTAPTPLEIETERDGERVKALIPAYHTVEVSNMKRLGELMSDPRVGDTRLWHRDIPYLVAGLNLGPYLYVYGPYNRYNLHKQGYMILGRDTLVEMWDAVGGQVRAHMASYLGSVAGSVSVDGEEFVSYLLSIEGSSWPLIPGPVAFRVNEDKLGLDFASITKRLFVLLEYPPVGGEVANLRAGAFERATQDMIDGTRWSPPDSLKLYRGRHLRLGGEQIGEVDAIAELDGTCILVSCKSRVYTADYDRGLYRVVRNTADYISHAVEDWEALVDRLRRNTVGDNYDLSAADDLRGVVTTPSVFYVPIEVAEKETLAGLKYYSSFGELEAWVSSDSGAGTMPDDNSDGAAS